MSKNATKHMSNNKIRLENSIDIVINKDLPCRGIIEYILMSLRIILTIKISKNNLWRTRLAYKASLVRLLGRIHEGQHINNTTKNPTISLHSINHSRKRLPRGHRSIGNRVLIVAVTPNRRAHRLGSINAFRHTLFKRQINSQIVFTSKLNC